MSLNLYLSILVCTRTVWELAALKKKGTKTDHQNRKRMREKWAAHCLSDSELGVVVLHGHLDSVYVVIAGSDMDLETQHVVRQEHTVYINHFRCSDQTCQHSLQLTVETFSIFH